MRSSQAGTGRWDRAPQGQPLPSGALGFSWAVLSRPSPPPLGAHLPSFPHILPRLHSGAGEDHAPLAPELGAAERVQALGRGGWEEGGEGRKGEGRRGRVIVGVLMSLSCTGASRGGFQTLAQPGRGGAGLGAQSQQRAMHQARGTGLFPAVRAGCWVCSGP